MAGQPERIVASYRILLQLDGLSSELGEGVARDVTAAFSRRNWHRQVMCNWDGKVLTLTVENDFDREGRATVDEFSDEISACVNGGFDGDIRLVSVTEIALRPSRDQNSSP